MDQTHDPSRTDRRETAPAAAADREGVAGQLENWADGAPRQVDPNSVTVARLVGALWVAVLAVLTLIPMLILSLTTTQSATVRGLILLAWLGFFAVLGGLSVVWPVWRYRRLSWWLDAQGVHIRRGVLWREEIAIPASRIQHTDVSQGPLERNYGIAKLIVYTAGTVNASVTLSGLSHAVALQLRDLLLEAGEDDGV